MSQSSGQIMMRQFQLNSFLGILILSLLVLFLMPSHQSLWIDEISTARLAGKPTFSDWLYEMRVGHVSEHQMPLSMAFAWVMARLFGTSEWGLRAVNLVWGAAAVLAFSFAGRGLGIRWLPLLLVVHPFFWYYMNEARPYAMQIACGAGLAYSLVLFVTEKQRDRWAIVFLISAFLLCGSSLLGVVPFAAATVVLVWMARQSQYKVQSSTWKYLLPCFVLFALLGAFYIWTLFKHSTGARQWTLGGQNIAFALFEFCGSSGLGPPRDILRDAARSGRELAQTLAPYSIGLIALALAYVALIAASFRMRMDDVQRKILFACIAVALLTFFVMYGLAYVVHWPFWGRHLAAVFPFLLMIIAISLNWLSNRSTMGRLLVLAFFVLFTISSLELRFNPAHGKDDYRDAVALARKALAHNQLIWWAADSETASYYGLPSDRSDLVMFWPPSQRSLETLPQPKLVFLSKRDIYDTDASITDYLRRHRFELKQTLPAFKIWEQPSPHPRVD